MPINSNYVKAFCYGLMFDKDVEPGTPVSISVISEDDILLAVKKAYIDMSPRTFKPNNKLEINADDKEKLLKELAKRICSYMRYGLPSGKTFDDWHKEQLCDFFLEGDSEINGLNKLLDDAKKDISQATFGKAQKIVNMTFKYMYCFDDANSYYSKFEPCHMPLDSYILDWFFERYKSVWKHPTDKKAKLTLNGKYRLPAWSNLEYEQGATGIIPQYKEIQDWIKKRLDGAATPVSRLEAEFLIWWQARNKAGYTY